MTTEISAKAESVSRARISKPSIDSHKADLDKIDAEIAALQKKQEDIVSEINGTSKGKGGKSDSRSSIIERLKVIRAEQAEIKKSRKTVFDQQDQLKSAIAKLTADIKSSQSKLKYHTGEEVDRQINALENQIEKGNLKLVEEKKIINEISNLRRAKKSVATLENQQKEIAAKRAELDEVYNQLRGTNAQALSEEYNTLQQQLDDMKDKFTSEKSVMDALYKKRNELREQIDKLYDSKRAAIASYKEKSNQFYLWQQEQKKQKYEQEKARRAQETRERVLAVAKEEQELAAVPAFQEEINICTNLLSYLQTTFNQGPAETSTTTKKDETEKPASTNIRQPDAGNNVPEGGKVLARKDDRNQDFFVGSSSKSKKKSSKSSGAKTINPKQGLRLPLSVLDSFNLLKVEPPSNMSSLAEAVAKVSERKEFYVKDQKRATEENKAKAEGRIAKLMKEIEENAEPSTSAAPEAPAASEE